MDRRRESASQRNRRHRRKRRLYRRMLYFSYVFIITFIVSVTFIKFTMNQLEKQSGAGGFNGLKFIETLSNKKSDNIDKDEYPENLVRLYEKNPDAKEFVLNYFEDKDKEFDIDLSEYRNCTSVPLLMQWDKRWGYKKYSGDLFGLTGCGPTCLSMAAIYLTGDASLTPAYMADYASRNGYSVNGSGTAWSFIYEGGADMGINVSELSLSKERIDNNLSAGNLIICIMGPGDFTDNGHFIVLTGLKDGKYTVNDPNSYTNSEKTWSYDEISYQIRNLWVLQK